MRGIVTGILVVLLVVATPTGAVACDTSSWLQAEGTATPGATLTVRGGGLEPGAMTLVWDRSDGRIVGDASVAPDGSVDTEIEVPTNAAGRHKIIAISTAGLGSAADSHAWTDVIVAEAAPGQPAAPAPSRAAATGSALLGGLSLGLAVLVALLVGLTVRRRRAAARCPSAGDDVPDPLDAELYRVLHEERPAAAAVGGSGPPVDR